MTGKDEKLELLSICERLLEESLTVQEDEYSRKRSYLLSEDCGFTLYREADLLIKELKENKKRDIQRFQEKMDELYKQVSGNNYVHREADNLLVETLESLGYDLTKYKESERWFS